MPGVFTLQLKLFSILLSLVFSSLSVVSGSVFTQNLEYYYTGYSIITPDIVLPRHPLDEPVERGLGALRGALR